MIRNDGNFSNNGLPIDRETAKTAAQLGQAATGMMRGGGLAGGALAAFQGHLDADEAASGIESLAKSLYLTVDDIEAISPSVHHYLASISNMPVETAARFGASTLVSGAAGTLTSTLAGTLVAPGFGTVAGLAGGMAAGYMTGGATNGAVDALAGNSAADIDSVNLVLAASAPSPEGGAQTLSPGDVFAILIPQFSPGERDLIKQTQEMLGETADNNMISAQYGYIPKLNAIASTICGKNYDESKPPCEQIAIALAQGNLPPAVLLVHNDALEGVLTKIEQRRSTIAAPSPQVAGGEQVAGITGPSLPRLPVARNAQDRNTHLAV